ncbi:MAG: phosphoribosylformylglycinamidine synthase subunit PurQ [bacterium]
MRVGVVVFPGSNCDRDCAHVLSLVGATPEFVWHRDTDLSHLGAVVLPGGFSYGDYLRCGAVAKISPVMSAVREFAAAGRPVIGICNGFQILVESELLPGALMRNESLSFQCKDVDLRVESTATAFTAGFEPGTELRLPIANAEGNYTIDERGLAELEEHGQVVLRYQNNPNGSVGDIAGISNRQGNVVGMMPHPERASESRLGNAVGRTFFESVLNFVS